MTDPNDHPAPAPEMVHAPECDRPGLAFEHGYSITLSRCLRCGAVTTVRNQTDRSTQTP